MSSHTHSIDFLNVEQFFQGSPLLPTLKFFRIRLTPTYKNVSINIENEEFLVYPLVGNVTYNFAKEVGSLFGRNVAADLFDEEPIDILRGICRREPSSLDLKAMTPYVDLLLVSKSIPAGHTDMLCRQEDSGDHVDYENQLVGKDTHFREVRVFGVPPGFSLHCGETINIRGGWSSWPAHASGDELERYAEHEEVMFFITPGDYALMRCDGVFADGFKTKSVKELRNGQAVICPLGAHEIVAQPGQPLYYFWCYTSFLKKTYNRFATDCKTYVK